MLKLSIQHIQFPLQSHSLVTEHCTVKAVNVLLTFSRVRTPTAGGTRESRVTAEHLDHD